MAPFEDRGVIARQVDFTLLTTTLRMGSPIIAEVVIIDGTRATLVDDPLSLAARLAYDIRGLPNHVTMPNGIRWSKIPIVIFLENDDMVKRAYGDPALRTVRLAARSPGWDNVYRAAAAEVRDFGERLVDEYVAAGWNVEYNKGRYLRVGIPKARNGKVEPIETDLYDGTRDRRYQARTRRELLPVSLIFTDETAVEHDLEELRRKMPEQHPEGVYQRYMDGRTYLLGAAPYELLPHPEQQDPGTGEKRYADYGLNSLRLSDFSAPSRLVDLKTPQAKLLVGARKYKKFGSDITTGLAQLAGYRRDLLDPRSKELLARIFPNGMPLGANLLVAGTKADVDRASLEYERERYRREADLRTYDEVLEMAEQRYLADHSDPEDPYSAERLGLPPIEEDDDEYDVYWNRRSQRDGYRRRRLV